MEQRAKGLWKKMLADYEPPPLDTHIDSEPHAFMDERKSSMEDAWY